MPGAQVLVGFDDDYPAPVARVVLRARINEPGQVELGVIGRGDWQVRNGDDVTDSKSSTATGFGDDMLAPPARSEVVTSAHRASSRSS